MNSSSVRRLQRFLAPAVVGALLIATAAAFAITERLKLEKSPVYGTKITRHFSPTCGCARAKARIRVKLRHRDNVTLTIRDAKRQLVDTLVAGTAEARGVRVFDWNGRTSDGNRAPDGTYYVEIHLARQHRTLLLPNPILLDTTPPQIESASPEPPAFSPDGDHQADFVTIHYTLSEPAFVVAYVEGQRIVRSRFHRPAGSFTWAALLGTRQLPPGTYVLAVGATDLAGNSTPVLLRARVRVQLRYITLASHYITGVRARGRLEIGVSTNAKRYTWRLGSRHGYARGPLLNIPAPAIPGRYQLVVTEHGHSDHAVVKTRRA